MTLYMRNYRVCIAGDIRYYVGEAENDPDNTLGTVVCRAFLSNNDTPLPFPDGTYYSVITTTARGKSPGFAIRGTTLIVELPTDDIGGSILYYSNDGGYTWQAS